MKKIVERLKQGMELFHKPAKAKTFKNFRPPLTLQQQVQNIIRSERLNDIATESGHETFEEANDFDTGEDLDDPFTGKSYEFTEDDEVRLHKNLKEADKDIDAKRKAALKAKEDNQYKAWRDRMLKENPQLVANPLMATVISDRKEG